MTAQPEAGQGAPADEPSADQAWCQGRVALHLRVGVTGHRSLDQDDPALLEAVRDALDLLASRCRKGTAATPVSLTVVSALAEGADRIVVREATGRGASLEVVLPLPLEDYVTDFDSDKSRSEFFALLIDHDAAITELAATGARDEAYERAGRAIVERSDVLLALWDGRSARGRGGTAEIVSYARRRHVPVLQVTAGRPDPGSPHPRTVRQPELPEFFGLLSDDAFRQLDQFNSGPLRSGRRWPEPALLPPKLATPVPPRVNSFVNHAQPYFSRAEQAAGSWQRRFIRLTLLLYSLSAAAVIIVATQIIYFSHDPQMVWAEVVALATVVVILILGRRAHVHDRWLAARYLAERIRSGVFLAAVGGGDDLRTPGAQARPDRVQPPDRAQATDRAQPADPGEPNPDQEWVERAFLEIYWPARRSPAADSELPVLKDLLTEAWIDQQVRYHDGVHKRLTRRQRQLSWLAVALFAVSALAALFHSISLFRSDVWAYCSVIIPAVGAAISGYSAQREYARLSERSRLMVTRLRRVRNQVTQSERLSSLQHAALRTELLMRSETAEWYDVVRLRDLELPA